MVVASSCEAATVTHWTISKQLGCAASLNLKNISIAPSRVGGSDPFWNCFSGKLSQCLEIHSSEVSHMHMLRLSNHC